MAIPIWILKRISKKQHAICDIVEKMNAENTIASTSMWLKTLKYDKYLFTIVEDNVILDNEETKEQTSVSFYLRGYIKERLLKLYEEIKSKR